MTALLFALFFSTESCGGRYNPTLYPSYDVLNPGPEVRLNPLGFTAIDPATGAVVIEWDAAVAEVSKADLILVNRAFILWVYELKEEIKKLREELRKRK